MAANQLATISSVPSGVNAGPSAALLGEFTLVEEFTPVAPRLRANIRRPS